MRATFKTLVLVLSLFTTLPAFAVDWPNRSVLGVIGASFADCRAPVDSPLMGVGYAGCSYEALAVKLQKNRLLDALNITVQSTALGGGYSHDVPGTGWNGFLTQYNEMMARTFWFDGVPRLKYLLISIPNDCLHSVLCSQEQMLNGYIANIKQVANLAGQAGVTVIINGYPEWQDLDMNLAALVFGLNNVIDESNYNILKNLHASELSVLPGVIYITPWKDNFNTIDGLHPKEEHVKTAAKLIAKEIKKQEGM